MPEVTLRLAEPRDAEQVADVNVKSWQAAFKGQIASSFLMSLNVQAQVERFAQVLSRAPQVELWVAAEQDIVCGYGTIGPDRTAGARDGSELYALYLRPERIGQGIGRQLHDHLLQRLRDRHERHAVLWVLEFNARARRFYEASGWKLTGRREKIMLGEQAYPAVHYARIIEPSGCS